MEYQEQVFFNVPLSRLEPIFKRWVKEVQQEFQPQIRESATPSPDPLSDFIPKKDVRGVIASPATLWKMEQAGKLKAYGFGGKRYYKRSELVNLFEEVKIKGLNHGK